MKYITVLQTTLWWLIHIIECILQSYHIPIVYNSVSSTIFSYWNCNKRKEVHFTVVWLYNKVFVLKNQKDNLSLFFYVFRFQIHPSSSLHCQLSWHLEIFRIWVFARNLSCKYLQRYLRFFYTKIIKAIWRLDRIEAWKFDSFTYNLF